MKKYFEKESNTEIYMGETAEVKAMYKSIARNQNTNLMPLFSEMPKFSENKRIYGIRIDKRGFMTILTGDCFASMFLSGELAEA